LPSCESCDAEYEEECGVWFGDYLCNSINWTSDTPAVILRVVPGIAELKWIEVNVVFGT